MYRLEPCPSPNSCRRALQLQLTIDVQLHDCMAAYTQSLASFAINRLREYVVTQPAT
ncbi:hypothetical protein BD309DRAFT_959662 [Dichomitus squalens]|nr:hypothetical protein BD309DRAFT_959662 [Dichomitus squalens]